VPVAADRGLEELPVVEVQMAEHLGMCFGVRDAIDLAVRLTRQAPLTILGELAHNPQVVERLDDLGARRAVRPEEVSTRALLLTAHGTSEVAKRRLRASGHQVFDATCPLVKRAHLALARLVIEGRHPVVIGRAEHVEVRGLIGDYDDYTVIYSDGDLDKLQVPVSQEKSLGVVAQTTQPIDRVLDLVEQIRRRYPEADVRFVDTVCQPTKDRQDSLRRLACSVDVIIVVGGPESNNSARLTELARRLGRPAYQVSSAADLRAEWFSGVRTIGLTAGTSTPDDVIEGVRSWLELYRPGDAV
jgi:4-hydroxy-3-methylbut-2-enyl diphosphate reductase